MRGKRERVSDSEEQRAETKGLMDSRDGRKQRAGRMS
jgi:hypothetical protein